MLRRQTMLACRRFLLPVSAQPQPNRASGVGGFSPISTLLPVRNIQFHGVALLSNISSPESWRTDGKKDIFKANANASVSSKNARKKQVKKKTGLGLTSKKDESSGLGLTSKMDESTGLDLTSKKDESSGLGLTSKKDESTGLGLTSKKDESFGEWYSEVVVNCELIEYHDLGLYILRRWTMKIWTVMQIFFDAEIKKMDIKNAYFPPFLTEVGLQKDHNKRFAQEIATRPTNESVVYPILSNWISSYEDLPLKLNQWCTIVRWKYSHHPPFIRSREFFGQVGYTAFTTKEEADNEVLELLELYRRLYEECLAIPVVKGRKSELEKIVGGLYSTSVEAFIPNTGRGIEGATSHCLGQNFAQKYEIDFVNEKGEKGMVWQNFWAYSTVTIGVMVMIHGDNKGLVLPPKVAPLQIIIIPVPCKDADVEAIFAACSSTVQTLRAAGFRVMQDFRKNYSPGWKFSNWEMKGVPLTIEISPKDITKNQVQIIRRDNGSKAVVPTVNLVEHVRDLLCNIHESMFNAAKVKRDACKKIVYTWEEFMTALNEKKLILAPWCDEEEVEKDVRARTESELGSAKTLCSPFDQPSLPEGILCFASGKPAKKWTYWGRSY